MRELNVDGVFGIARSLLEKAEAARRPDAGSSEDRAAADIARDLIVWLDEAHRAMEKDRARFAALSASGEPWADANDEINSIGDFWAFEMGFDLAVQLTARIMLDPLESHDISDLLDKPQATYSDRLRYQRDEYPRHALQQRIERERAREARDVDLAGART